MQKTSETIPQPLLLNTTQACQVLCLGKTKLYELINNGGLPVIYIGRSPRFSYHALQQWIERRLQGDVV